MAVFFMVYSNAQTSQGADTFMSLIHHSNFHIAFLGAGNMATAIVQGLYAAGGYRFSVADTYAPALERWTCEFKATPLSAKPDAVVLAVKPQQFAEAALSLKGLLSPETVVISIMAGITIAKIQNALDGHAAVVRTMPNTPARIGQGITGLFATPACSAAQHELARAVMVSIGQTVFVDEESQLDAVTAVSGSGPAYVFYIAQAMTQAGVSLGLPQATARQLALATLQGSAALAQDSGEDLDALREQVTSKGGTTYAAMTVLQDKQVAQAFHAALAAANARAKELARLA
jgi:pyrroline-5-carboxylate reductase